MRACSAVACVSYCAFIISAVAESMPTPTNVFNRTIISNGGGYTITVTSAQTIQLNELLGIIVDVTPKRNRTHPLTLLVDARMPEHNHGMETTPMIKTIGNNRFEVAGLLFHMPGRWQMHFDVYDGRYAERGQFDIEVR